MGHFAPKRVIPKGELEAFQHLPGVPIYLDLLKDLGDLAGPVDQEGRPCNAHVLSAVQRFFDPDAVLLAGIVILVREEAIVEFLSLPELLVGLDGVLADAQYDGALLGNGGEFITEPANFDRSAGGEVLWVKKEHDLFPGQQLERNGRSIIRRQAECRRG